MNHGVFVKQPRVGGSLASAILEAINVDIMPEWTQEMADAAAKRGLVYTNELKLQALLGRGGVAPKCWREPHTTMQLPSALPVTAVSDTDI
ncbi:hypothetical protein SEPCBS57363_006174 [Sporothrix epigloea]|uniref:Uncharacterized protein n=1 Tax=Sporothrix epigloea TaxID=1892477 RepID=A0ABP0E1N5_9PEZI